MRPIIFLGAALTVLSSNALAQVTEAEAEAAIMTYVNAVIAGDRSRLMEILAPEFQIQRPDGTGHDRETYVAGEFLAISQFLGISDLFATSTGDIMVARYVLHLNSTLDGRPVEALAPRLTVFRRDGDAWLVVAHANFAQIEAR